jgi:signal transduction histidine kinase
MIMHRLCLLLLALMFSCIKLYAQDARDSVIHLPFDVLSSHLSQSEIALREAYLFYDQSRNLYSKALAAKQLSTVHYLKGTYDSSAYYIVEAIKGFEALNKPDELGEAYCEYGYRIKRRNLPEAFRYMSKGIRILEDSRFIKKLTAAYDNFGVLHELNATLDSAAWYYNKALALKENLRDSVGLPYSLNNLGGVEIMQGRYELALPYLQKALDIRTARDDKFGIAESYALFGDLYKSWKKYSLAIEWFGLSAQQCNLVGYPFLLQQNQDQLASCYEQTGQFDLATMALKRSASLKDSLLNEKNLVQINELEQRFRVVEKDKAIAQLQERAARKQLLIVVIVGLFLLAAAIFVLIYQRQKRKANEARDAAIIEERERGLDAVFTATEEERKRIAKDLHDGVGQQLSGLRMGFESLTLQVQSALPHQQEAINKMTQVIDEACKDVRNLAHQMMPKALSESGLIASIDDMLNKSLGLTKITYRLEHFNVDQQRYNEKVELGLYRVCQELVNNIIKHSGASEVVVQLFKSKGLLILIVEDNGRGFAHTKNSAGIGLSNITSRIHTVDGDVSWEPGPQSGTVATVKVPV